MKRLVQDREERERERLKRNKHLAAASDDAKVRQEDFGRNEQREEEQMV